MFEELLRVIRRVRKECPWDRRQTLSSSRPLLINEVFELDEALRTHNKKKIQEELGDYFIVGLFIAQLLGEKRGINLKAVEQAAVAKLKRRHPHIYRNLKVKGVDDVLKNWEKIKRGKRKKSILDGVPRALPALQQAQLIQERCRRVGFDWQNYQEVWEKVEEEMNELKTELKKKPLQKRKKSRLKEEVGDFLFALVNLSRHLGVDAEGALKDTNQRFRKRFQRVEEWFQKEGRDISSVSPIEMNERWERVKRRGE